MPRPYYSKVKHCQAIIRVNHAGEFGAKRIYEGQIDYTHNINDKNVMQHMLAQEREHLEYFNNQIKYRHVRPTLLIPIWNFVGYWLGAISAKCGNKVAMLVTQSIEEVIVQHYQDQIHYLECINTEKQLLQAITQFKEDEENHIHIALENNSAASTLHDIISVSIKFFCRTCILLSQRI